MIYVRFIELLLFIFCTCAFIAFASPSFGGIDYVENRDNLATPKQKLEGKIGLKLRRPLPPTPKRTAPERPQFTNLQQEAKVYGIPRNLNLDTLYKVNPKLWDEFRRSFPKIPSNAQPSAIQPFFARFIQDYILAGIYETSFPAFSWYEETKDFDWRDILHNPQYQEMIKSKRQEKRSWFITDIADWIQRSYIQSQKANTRLPWQPAVTTSTQPNSVGSPPPPPPPPPRAGPKTWSKIEGTKDPASTSKTSKTNVGQPPKKIDPFEKKIREMAAKSQENRPSIEEMDRIIEERKALDPPRLSGGIGGALFNTFQNSKLLTQGEPEKTDADEGSEDSWGDIEDTEDDTEELTNTERQPTTNKTPTQQSKAPIAFEWLTRLSNMFQPATIVLTERTEIAHLKALTDKTNANVAMYEKREKVFEEEKRILENIALLTGKIKELKRQETVEAKKRLEWLEVMLPQMQEYLTKKSTLDKRIIEINRALKEKVDEREERDLVGELQSKQNALSLIKNPSSNISARIESTKTSKATALRELTAVQKKIQIRNEASKNLEQIIKETPNEEDTIAEIKRDIEKLNSEIEHLFNKYLMLEIEAYTGDTKSATETLVNALKFRRQQAEEEEEEEGEDDSDYESDDDSWLDK